MKENCHIKYVHIVQIFKMKWVYTLLGIVKIKMKAHM